MSIMSKLLKQCRKPKGWLGRLTAWEMNTGHSKLTAWGLEHISIGKYHAILDVGCGGGVAVHKLAKIDAEGKVYGVDFFRRVCNSFQENEQAVDTDRERRNLTQFGVLFTVFR